MLAKNPVKLDKVNKVNTDSEMLRLSIISEMDAISLYEQMAETTTDSKLKKLFLDIAKEEKTHVGEFQSLLLLKDKEQGTELEEGKREAAKVTKYVVLQKGFKMEKQQEGESEKASRKKEHEESGEEDLPHIARLKERAKRRREEQEPPEQ